MLPFLRGRTVEEQIASNGPRNFYQWRQVSLRKRQLLPQSGDLRAWESFWAVSAD